MSMVKVLRSRIFGFGVLLAMILAMASGCEWTSSGNEGSWNDSMSWVNFSGMYRAPSGRRLVGDFSSAGAIDGSTAGTGTDTDGSVAETRVVGQDGGTEAAPFTVLTGVVPFTGGNIKPGSLTINLRATTSGAQGQFEDNSNGGLQGSFAQVPPASPIDGTGSINYETGAFRINLDAVYLDEAAISFSYVIQGGGAPDGGTTPGDGGANGGAAGISTLGGTIATMQIEQLGNKLTFRTSTGHVLTGRLNIVTLPGGDQTGRSAGDVSATYEVSGEIGGRTVRISGTLSGVYVPPADIQFTNTQVPVIYGILSNRTLQGIWMQPNGTADVFGVAPQQSVPVNVGDFAPIVSDEGTGQQQTQPTVPAAQNN